MMSWNVILTGNANLGEQQNMFFCSEVLLALHQENTANLYFPLSLSEFCLSVNYGGTL